MLSSESNIRTQSRSVMCAIPPMKQVNPFCFSLFYTHTCLLTMATCSSCHFVHACLKLVAREPGFTNCTDYQAADNFHSNLIICTQFYYLYISLFLSPPPCKILISIHFLRNSIPRALCGNTIHIFSLRTSI